MSIDVDSLRYGLKEMISLLKSGLKDSAKTWFRSHYYALHKYDLLQDSIIRELAVVDTFPEPESDPDTTISNNLHQLIKTEIRDIAVKLGEPPDIILPDDFIADVEKYIIKFSQNEGYRGFFQDAINKSRKYIPLFEGHFTEKGFPVEVLFFSMIESGYNSNAISVAGAAGMFQFMPETARQYGLIVNERTDERFSAIKSAQAAALYLKDLYLELGSLNLAFSSYNAGPGRTRSALRKLNSVLERNYWEIRKRADILVHETREYVPQIFAAIVMAKEGNPHKFGLIDPGWPERDTYKTFYLPKKINIEDLLNSVALPLVPFLKVNPDLKISLMTTPANEIDYPLNVPVEYQEETLKYLKSKLGNFSFNGTDKTDIPVAVKQKKKPEVPKVTYRKENIIAHEIINKGESFDYMVQPFNTLHMVARIFAVSEKNILEWNSLKFKTLMKGKTIKIIAPRTLNIYTYKIPEKMSFSKLANQFDLSPQDLKKTNPYKSETLNFEDTVLIYKYE